MKITLREARDEARRFRRNGDHPRALRAYQRILAALPLDYETRFAIADVLAEAGHTDAAADVYRSVAVHDIRAGHPLPAIVAAHALGKLGRPVDDVHALLVKTYASGSPLLARFAVRPAPVDPSTMLEIGDIAHTGPLTHVVEQAHKTALDLSVFVGYQEQYHPLPFLSDLGPESLVAMLRSLAVLRLTDGQVVVRQGDAGDSLFLVAGGELRVFVNTPAGEKDVARLFENTLFGEMALITGQPRSASVAAAGDADVIGISKAALDHVIARLPAIRAVLDGFSRERLIKNLLQTSPLFVPFTKSQQGELLRRFEGHEVEAGTNLIREGEQGKGLFLVLAGEVEVISRADTPEAPQAGDVRFEKVCFSYEEGRPVINQVDFQVPRGKTLALIGATGSGKTTIVNLLTRFYDADSGRISVDGRDIRLIPKPVLRRQLGVVLQDTFLFSGSVRDNIRYGRPDASDDEIIHAAQLANAHHFIHRLPEGYATVLSEGGADLSQGQRQLIAIARTVLADPRVLILDEATSSIDTRTEVAIQEAMSRLMAGRTCIVIAHRLRTIRNADEVLILKEGRIIRRGTHRELFASGGRFETPEF